MLPKLNKGFLALGDTAVPYELRRSRRRRTLGLTVTAQQVRIHAPSWTPRAEIDHYVQQQHHWLQRTWARMQADIPAASEVAPTQLMYLGRHLSLKIHASLFSEVRRTGKTLYVYAPVNMGPEVMRAWLQVQAEKLLAWRLAKMARRLGRMPVRFALSNAQTQWGSCTRSGNIRLSWRLIQAPLTLIDYVAAHELAHLIHFDHSPAFWAQVAAICPETLARRAALRKMSVSLFRI